MLFRSGGEENKLDYSVISVGVTTLGLILAVEFVRHKLDLKAIGRPFFKTVLEGVYRECEFQFITFRLFFFSEQNLIFSCLELVVISISVPKVIPQATTTTPLCFT